MAAESAGVHCGAVVCSAGMTYPGDESCDAGAGGTDHAAGGTGGDPARHCYLRHSAGMAVAARVDAEGYPRPAAEAAEEEAATSASAESAATSAAAADTGWDSTASCRGPGSAGPPVAAGCADGEVWSDRNKAIMMKDDINDCSISIADALKLPVLRYMIIDMLDQYLRQE